MTAPLERLRLRARGSGVAIVPPESEDFRILAAGRANVLVFPDLDAGNIGYQLTGHDFFDTMAIAAVQAVASGGRA